MLHRPPPERSSGDRPPAQLTLLGRATREPEDALWLADDRDARRLIDDYKKNGKRPAAEPSPKTPAQPAAKRLKKDRAQPALPQLVIDRAQSQPDMLLQPDAYSSVQSACKQLVKDGFRIRIAALTDLSERADMLAAAMHSVGVRDLSMVALEKGKRRWAK